LHVFSLHQILLGLETSEVERGEICSTHERGDKCTKILVGNPEGKCPLRRPKRRREDNIKGRLK